MGGVLPRSSATETTRPPIKLGLIGCGWYGMVDVKAAFKVGGVEIVAVCDVDSEHLQQSADELEKLQGKRPRTLQALPGPARRRRARRRDHRHAAALARPAVHRGAGRRAGRLLRKAARLRHPRRPGDGRGRARRQAASCRSASSAGRARRSRQVQEYIRHGQGRPDRPGRRPDPLHRRHEGPHAAGPARLARLGPLVRSRAQDPLQPAGRPHELAAGEDHRATGTWSTGAST